MYSSPCPNHVWVLKTILSWHPSSWAHRGHSFLKPSLCSSLRHRQDSLLPQAVLWLSTLYCKCFTGCSQQLCLTIKPCCWECTVAWSRQSFSRILHISFCYFSARLVITSDKSFRRLWTSALVLQGCFMQSLTECKYSANATMPDSTPAFSSSDTRGRRRKGQLTVELKESGAKGAVLQQPWRS